MILVHCARRSPPRRRSAPRRPSAGAAARHRRRPRSARKPATRWPRPTAMRQKGESHRSRRRAAAYRDAAPGTGRRAGPGRPPRSSRAARPPRVEPRPLHRLLEPRGAVDQERGAPDRPPGCGYARPAARSAAAVPRPPPSPAAPARRRGRRCPGRACRAPPGRPPAGGRAPPVAGSAVAGSRAESGSEEAVGSVMEPV